jgi:hypothetical protein
MRWQGGDPRLPTKSPNPSISKSTRQSSSWFGENESAVRWLRHSFELGVINYPLFTHHIMPFRALKGFAPYDALMEDVRLRAAQLEG